MKLFYAYINSPVGKLKLIADDQALLAVLWENDRPNRVKFPLGSQFQEAPEHTVLAMTNQQLQEYFSGQRQQFELPLAFHGTGFQQQVWQALLTIPFGETRSYKQIAEQIGNVKAVRAVGAANGKNPISIIAPCHRVVGANGKLVGFAGGLENKATLLKIEN